MFLRSSQQSRKRYLFTRWAPLGVLLITILATLGVAYRADVTRKARDNARFESAVRETNGAVQERINIYVAILRSGAAMMTMDEDMTRTDFGRFVNRLLLEQHYPGIQGVGYAKKVLPGERESFEERLRSEFKDDSHIYPTEQRDIFFPILYLQPEDERNQKAVGYDMFSDPVRREAMKRARDTGVPAASGRVTLVQEIGEEKQPGFLIYLPVYHSDRIPPTIEERRENLVGFFYSPFRTEDLFDGIFGMQGEQRVRFEIYDGKSADPENLLYSSVAKRLKIPQMEITIPLITGGQPWTIHLESTARFEASSTPSWVWNILLGGLLLSGILYGVTKVLARALAAAEESRHLAIMQREEYQVTLASIADAVIATDEEGRIVFMNTVAEELTQKRAGEMRGQPLENCFQVLDGKTRKPVQNPVTVVLGTKSVVKTHSYLILLRRNGEERMIEDSAAPIRGQRGSLKGAVLIFRDISARIRAENKRREAEQALLESETRFRLIIENSKDFALFTYDHDGKILHWNPGAQKVFGYLEEEIVGKNAEVLFTTENRETGVPEEERKVAEETGSRMDERWLVRKDGSRFFTSSAIGPVPDADGTIREFAKAVWDITKGKETEESLERMVDERTTQLTTTISDLEAFSYSISHDLRAPLRAMQGFAQVLEEDYGDQFDDTGRDYIHRIISAGTRLDELIRDVLTYSRISRTELVLERVDLDQLVRNIQEETPTLQEPTATMEIVSPLAPVTANAPLLSQSISNLLSNAVKFVPCSRKPHVRIWSELRGDRVRIWVEDNGIGIVEERQGLVFGMFERVHTEGVFEGTGIGLAIVQKAMDRMGGATGIESVEGEGSQFWIELSAS